MFVEKIELQGFKSFAQKTTLHFPPPQATGTCGIACIVGPNGSGKSNLVDAIRWVLGEQSLKSLRGKKSQDVIFLGSETRSRLGMTYVELVINNADHVLPVDYDQVIISRKMYRDGESEYRINGSKVRLQDVLLLAARANFGQKSYSIISQGSIDQVIMASPADRKTYFDEAVGVKEFQLKRDQSLNRLENAWNNLLQVDALLTEIKPRLNSLNRQVKRLERREKIEVELKTLQQKYYGWLDSQLKNQINLVRPKLNQAESDALKQQNILQQHQRQLTTLEKEDSGNKTFNNLQQHYQKLNDQKNKLRERQLILQHKIELAKNQQITKNVALPLAEILRQLKAIDVLHQKINTALETNQANKLAQAKADSWELKQLITTLLHQLEAPQLKTKTPAEVDQQLLAELTGIESELKGMDGLLQQASAALANFNQEQEKQKGKFFDLQRQLSAAQNLYNQKTAVASELRVELAKLETRQQGLRQEIKDEMQDSAWLTAYQPTEIKDDEVHQEILKLRHQLELIGGVDPQTIDEYQKVKERHDFLDTQAEDLRTSIKSLEKVIDVLDDRIQEQFDSAFKSIDKEFSKFFKILFNGGKAQLALIKEDINSVVAKTMPTEELTTTAGLTTDDGSDQSILDQLQDAEKQLSPKRFLKKRTGRVITGIDITASPPGKKVSAINMLSGGERSMASIALICAIISNNPSPFVILDEVDAALDEANSQRFSKILDELAHKTQFIVITHNRSTMQKASILYGVTIGDDGISHLLSLRLEDAAKIVRQ